MILPRAADGDAAHQVPLDEPPDVDRDVALALLELRGDLVERERAALHVEEGEDPALQLVQNAAGGGRGADAVDEECRGSVHHSGSPLCDGRLEYFECSGKGGQRDFPIGSTERAIELGLARTGKLVTSGALILMFAFLVLSTSPGYEVKPLAIGIAAGIILDATVIRALLVPALMRLLGDANWWMPKWTSSALRIRDRRRLSEPTAEAA